MEDISELRRSYAAGEQSAVERVGAALERAESQAHLNAWIRLDRDGALEAAAALDARRAAGESLGPLAGVPIGLKDTFLTEGLQTTCGSRILEGYVPPFDATVVSRLRAADALLIGKLNQDEFAMGSSNENSAFGAVLNPVDIERTPGGSSGGCAAAVAAGHCAGALGTDTGGSVRQPAALCGVVGLKPTYGRMSRFGVIAYASSLDQPGPLARDVRGVAALMAATAGFDPRDATSADTPVPSLSLPKGQRLDGLRVGVPTEYFPEEGLQPEVGAAVREAIAALEALGAEVVEVSLPHTAYAVAAYYLIATAEASSNLGRYDGMRYGPRAQAQGLHETYRKTRAAFGDEVKRRIMLGTFALSAGYYEAYYRKASQVRTLLRQDFDRAFVACDVIATPTSPTTAFRLGERMADPLQMYLADIFTISCNLAGLPGLSLPCGLDGAGLPIGLQLIGKAFDEATILGAAAAYEDAR